MISVPQYLLISGITFDTLITAIGVLKYHWKESNQFISWIQPPELMISFMILSNIFFAGVMLLIHQEINRTKKIQPVPDFLISFIGLIRMVCGMMWVIL